MKTLIATLMVCSLVASVAHGSGIGIFGSYWAPQDTDDALGGGAKVIIGGDPVAFEVRGIYFEDLTDDSGPNDFELECIPLEAGLLLGTEFNDTLDLYLGAGGGYYFLDSNRGDPDDEVGFYASGGVELAITDSISLFAEGIYRWVNGTAKDDDLDNIDSGTDFDLDGFGANVGLLFH